MSRKIEDLHPKIAAMCRAFITECKRQGVEVIITSTYRTPEEQEKLYAIGRTIAGKKVTNAKPGQSYHNYGLAFDFVPIYHSKAIWNNPILFKSCGIIGESLGLEWAGRWTGKMREAAHLQYTGGLTLADLKSGKHLA